MTAVEYHSDAELVSRTLAGERDAFNRIVSRYQTLICSLAYSRIGHIGQSEDVAQETFITAWKHLRLLREPEKLRAWLCGIVRNRSKKALQREGREPAHDAEPLDTLADLPASEALPSEQTISREEEAILWRSLERIPELYREPLILFYREHQSIEHVAVELELSEDAVKQRLSRGRKLLQEEVQAFVEKTLRRTAPTQAFSNAVLAALPLAVGPAAAVGAGAGAKGAAAAKSGFVAACLMPFLGILAGILAQGLIIRATTSERRLRFKKQAQMIASWVVLMALAVVGENAVDSAGHRYGWSAPTFFTVMACFWCLFSMVIQAWTTLALGRILAFRRVSEEAGETPRPATAPMNPGTLAVVVAGVHLALFFALIRVAWIFHDRLGAGAIAGMMLLLIAVAFCRIRGRTGAALAQACSSHMGICFVLLLAILNLRFDVWMAYGRGVSVAEIHQQFPTWIVPLLTLAFVIWTAMVLALAKSMRRSR